MGVRFRGDRRAVSEVVGAILLLGILILALTSYQAAVVPNQNAQTEFQHNLQVEDEMVELRNALLEARSSGTETFAAITLGTQYRDRTFAINPPPATGTLQTVQQDNISVTEDGGQEREDPLRLDDRPLENQFIEYTPRYSEYQSAGTMRYENTITYHQYPTANVTLTSQRLLQDERVTLAPIEGTVSESGIRRVTVDPVPGVLQTTDVEDPEIILPTKLSEVDWNRILDEELSDGESVSVEDGVLTMSLEGTYEIAYSPVGANRAPREGTRGGTAGEINPAAPGNVQLLGTEWSQNTVTMSFRNSADNSSFTEGRLNFLFGNTNAEKVERVNAPGAGSNPRGENWVAGSDFKDLDPDIFLEGDGAITEVEYVFDRSVNPNQDFFVTTLTLESGERATYFVGGVSGADEEEDEEENGGNGEAATNVELVSSEAVGGGSRVVFDLENTGGSSATIERISVDSASNTAVRVEETAGGNVELSQNNNDRLDQVIEIGGQKYVLDTFAEITGGDTDSFELRRFRNSDGSRANMADDTVEITLQFTDGSEATYTLDLQTD